MKTQRDQIIHPMEKLPDEYELTQNPVTREFHKENANDCLRTKTMIQERMKEQTSLQEASIEVEGTNLQKAQDTPILDSRAGVDDSNLEAIDSQIQIEESNCSQNFETQEKENILMIHVTIKEKDLISFIFQISAVSDPQEAQVINELNRDPKVEDSQDCISDNCLNLKNTIQEETNESRLEDSVELSPNVNPKEDQSSQEWMKELEPLKILRGPPWPPLLDFLPDSPIWDSLEHSITLVSKLDLAINTKEARDLNLIIVEDPTPLQELRQIRPLEVLRGPPGPLSQDFLSNPSIWDKEPDIEDQIMLFP
ncbi:hypothetical protein AMTRI_Chr02g261230 [Amborella trichopoda]